MKKGSQSKPALDLIEEATHVLRTSAVGTLALYYVGTAPFVLALLFFWADMSRNPFAEQHLADTAFVVAALFVWMKFWQALFARRVRARLAGEAPAPLRAATAFRVAVTQTALQPLGLLPIGVCISASIYSPLFGLLLALAVGGMLTLFYNITAVGDGSADTVREVFKKAWRLWMLWPRQNLAVLVVLYVFGFCVFLSVSIFCGSLPGLLQTLFGFESVFTQSAGSLLNSTFFAAMFGLAYLCVDPILKTVYALRCYYGESLKSGEDLKAELKRFGVSAGAVGLAVMLGAYGFGSFSARARASDEGSRVEGRGIIPPELWAQESATQSRDGTGCNPFRVGNNFWDRFPRVAPRIPPQPWAECWNPFGVQFQPPCPTSISNDGNAVDGSQRRASRRRGTPYLSASGVIEATGDLPQTVEKTAVADSDKPGAGTRTIEGGGTVSSPDLDHAINQTIHERKYTWRMPRETTPKDTKQGVIGRFFENVADMFRKAIRAMYEWWRELMRKLFPRRNVSHTYHGSGNWITSLQTLLFVLITVAVCALAIFIYRLWMGKPRLDAVASEPLQKSVPDITDENVGADQMPEDGWTRLGRELLERGEFRLALRAFYLASLAHLARRSLITLARFKSNHDYERELHRRGHSFPDLLSIFGDNLPVFERSWYGRHDVNGEMVNEFAARVERMKGAA